MDYSYVFYVACFVICALNCCWAGVNLWRSGKRKRRTSVLLQGALLIVTYFVLVRWEIYPFFRALNSSSELPRVRKMESTEIVYPDGERARKIVKKECQKLVDGLLVFQPATTMKEGQSYVLFARITRNEKVNILEGLKGSRFIEVKKSVSCKVSMRLDSAEADAFKIETIPATRPDEQILQGDGYTEWDWRVTPLQDGTLHLLLYVEPVLYVQGLGEGLKSIPQPPEVITVSPDYIYESSRYLKQNWTIIGGLLTSIFIPVFLFSRQAMFNGIKKRFAKKKPVGFNIS